ncbi:MAG: valine--tRNA ligase [Thermoplasmata archaeon]
MSATELPSRFDARTIEPRWQSFWASHQYFRAPEEPRHPTFVIPGPPPNVTGVLTLGHTLGDTVRDLFARWTRMRGQDTLWFPGIDHAGLATQIEVRRALARQGIRLENLSATEALHHMEEWKAERERHIEQQTRSGGFSIDWSRYRYTMDPGFARATREAFVRLYESGLVYRGERFVNWDPELMTAVSDLEVVHSEEEDDLLYVRYPWADGAPGGIVVATVRPETIFGDIAVAVHPADDRHRRQVGRQVRVPLTDRTIPIISDDLVDPAFGNGALKLTPRHDLLDYQIFGRHPELRLPPSILDPRGQLESEWVPLEFRGLDRKEARRKVADALALAGWVDRSEPIRHMVARSERSKAILEPRISEQWFVRMTQLSEPVVAAVRAGSVRLHPDRWGLTFFRWMEALEDWCISRQILWGHPIPVYYCDTCHAVMARVESPVRCTQCGGTSLRPDPDVLDTWFSSWLWPFAALGWPEETSDLRAYYPASLLVTGRDIMFFWVARMLMAGFYFTGQAPFDDVYFTGMLRDEEGRRMSKHLGNSPDPMMIIEEKGADALRFALIYPNPVDQDAAFGSANLDQARNFLTKVWNLVRFASPYLPVGMTAPTAAPVVGPDSPLEERWILSRWRRMSEELDAALEAFEPTVAAGVLYAFLWHDLADRYVEIAKESLSGRGGDIARRRSQGVLLFILERTLRQLHPFVPHITEELWHVLPHEGESLAVASWPRSEETPRDPAAEVAMDAVVEAIRMFRNLKAEQKIAVRTLPSSWLIPSGPRQAEVFRTQSPTIVRLARLGDLTVLEPGASRPAGGSAVTPQGEYFISGAPGGNADRESLTRERAKLAALLDKTRGRLADGSFLAHAPPEVVKEAEAKATELAERIQRIDAHLMATPESETAS